MVTLLYNNDRKYDRKSVAILQRSAEELAQILEHL